MGSSWFEPFAAPELERACLWAPDPVVREQAWAYLWDLHVRDRNARQTLWAAAIVDRAVEQVRKALGEDADG